MSLVYIDERNPSWMEIYFVIVVKRFITFFVQGAADKIPKFMICGVLDNATCLINQVCTRKRTASSSGACNRH